MNNVIVLLDDPEVHSRLLKNLGVMDVQYLSYLCRQRTAYEEQLLNSPPKTWFLFETYDLMTRNKKIDDLISSKDGVLVFVDYVNANTITTELTERIQHIKCRPLLVIINNCPEGLSPDKYLISSTNTDSFRVKHIANNVSINSAFNGTDINSWFIEKLNKAKVNEPSSTILTSKNISDIDLTQQFEDGTLPLVLWDHYCRLRIVYLGLQHGINDAINKKGWLCKNWKKYKNGIGHGHLWNYTLTIFWVKQIYSLMDKDHKSFSDIYNQNPHLHNGRLHEKYYSKSLIFSELAKHRYIEPDLQQSSGTGCIIV